MAKKSSANPLINLLLMVIALIIGVFYALFLPETPSSTTGSKDVQIPLSGNSLTSPGQIQGASTTSGSLQNAAKLNPDRLNSLAP